MQKVSVVIPVYCQWNLVKRNVDALIKYDRNYLQEIILVDDCSPEPNPYHFNEELVTVIINERNAGYTATVNHGLRKAHSELVVLLDSDAYPVGSFLQKLITEYSDDPLTGCIGFATMDERGRSTGNFQYEPSIMGLVAGQLLETRLGLLRFWRRKNILPYSCAVSFRKCCLQEMDYFDESVFPVLEADNDISMRIHRSRWKLHFEKEIVICHAGGNSYKVDSKRVRLFHKSRWSLLTKHRLIKFPSLAKFLIKARIQLELFVFSILSLNKARRISYLEKMAGRRIILKDINLYR